MKQKVIFLTTYPDVRITKRIDEFKTNGYDVSAYSFVRKNIKIDNWPAEVMKLNEINQNYLSRIIPIIKGFFHIRKIEKGYKYLYYYMGLDIAIIGRFVNKKVYIYEEADLTYTDLKNFFLKYMFELFNKIIIKKSLLTVFTSEGFIDYHYKNNKRPKNISLIPNKLDIKNLEYKAEDKIVTNLNILKIGFVGFIRYDSIINFAKVFASKFPNYEFHFYGVTVPGTDISSLISIENIFFHGAFKSPENLPEIYNSIDLLLATYDIKFDNVRCAEPNKLYESIYYQTPIIVSKNTFLAKKVNELGVGYQINAMNNNEIISFVQNLNLNSIEEKIINCRQISSSYLVNNNALFFEQLYNKLSLL